VTAERLTLEENNLLIPETQKKLIKNQQISMISQDPRASLNPIMTVREQIAEVFLNKKVENIEDHVLHSLEEVHVDNPMRVLDLYPHEISGGMGQRIMIAMMIAMQPKLLIADEPTSALDACIKHEILHLLEEKIEQYGMKLILISHDLPLVKKYCDKVLVLYKGEVMDYLDANKIEKSKHPYVQALMNSIPRIDQDIEKLPSFSRKDS
jgi:peptide/nickel transport system ATP-binding protein